MLATIPIINISPSLSSNSGFESPIITPAINCDPRQDNKPMTAHNQGFKSRLFALCQKATVEITNKIISVN